MLEVSGGHALRAKVYIDRRVLVVRLFGVLSPDSLAGVARALARRYGRVVRAFVVDFRGGLLAAASWELKLIKGLPMPGAFVAEGPAYDSLRLHCLRRETEGLARRVTTDLQVAVSWASEQASRA